MSAECLYIAGSCSHAECAAYWRGGQSGPTEADYCASGGHTYYGDEFNPDDCPVEYLDKLGRCYCGERRYPAGGDA